MLKIFPAVAVSTTFSAARYENFLHFMKYLFYWLVTEAVIVIG